MSRKIANRFFVLQYDVYKFRDCTTEYIEHVFWNMRIFCREFSALDSVSLSERENLQSHTMFAGQLLTIRDTKNGYNTIDFDWIQHANMNYSELQGGPCEVGLHPGADPVYEQVWPFLNKIITEDIEKITPQLELAGVTDEQKPSL